MNETHWKTACPKVDCRKKNSCRCGLKHVVIPASLGDDSENSSVAPKNGEYCNAIVIYEANKHVYIYSSEGIPTIIDVDATDISELEEITREALEKIGELDNSVVLAFDSVAEMKSSVVLINGSYVRTLGYYSKGDGGGAFYVVTSTQPSGYYESLPNGNYAELILEADMDVRQFGAKGDGTTNDYNAISAMISACGYLHMSEGNYKITSTLYIGQLRDINIKGTITYSGNNSAIKFTGGNYLNVYIKSIVASNGECIKISPESSSLPFSFNRIYLGYGNAGSHTVELDGDEAAICNVFFDGIRWHSETTSPCHVTMTADANSSFINEIVFNNVNFWGSAQSRAGVTVNNASNNEIQLKFDKANFENSWGIHTYGKVVDISLTNCRIGEIKDDSGWLTFDSYLPKVSITGVGDNYLDLSNITLTNIASSAAPFLTTNLTIQDHDTTYLFDGGGVGFTDYIVPFVVPDATKTYSSTGDITYSDLSLGGGLYNRFNFTGNGWVSFTLPTNLFYCTQNNVLITTTYAISLTVILSTGGSTTFITEANTTYLLKKIGNGIKYAKLS